MRLNPKLVHPELFKAVDTYQTATLSGVVPADPKAANEHMTAWFATYGAQFWTWVAVNGAVLIGGIFLAKTLPKPIGAFAFIAVFLAIVASAMYSYSKQKRLISAAELRALLPNLELSDAQRAYGEAVLAVHDALHSESEVHEVMSSLNTLLDEDANLLKQRESLQLISGGFGSLREELEALRGRLEATKDASARDLLQESIQILETRMAGAGDTDAILDRINAQLELIRQTILSVRDTYRRLGQSGSSETGPMKLDHLRNSVALNQEQARAIEAAVREVQAL